MNPNSLCRLCAGSLTKFVKIYGQEGESSILSEKIKQCLQISIETDDELPKLICLQCYGKVESFYSFFISCKKTQERMFSNTRKEGSHDSLTLYVFPNNDKETEYYSLSSFVEKDTAEYSVENLLLEGEKRQIHSNLISPHLEEQNSVEIEDILVETEANHIPDCENGILQNDILEDNDFDDDLIEEDEGRDDNECFGLEKSDGVTSKKLFDGYTWKCCDCEKTFASLVLLRQHFKEIHNSSPKYQCMQCSKVYNVYRSFAKHAHLHVNGKTYSCNICGKSFSQKSILQSHRTVHSEERPHVCPQCGKAFKQYSSLYLHTKCHLPKQAKTKYPCSICYKTFSSKTSADLHMRMHRGEKNFVCDVCGKCFISKGSLDYHIANHRDDKPHSCQVCGRCFKTARLLARHGSVHTGVKPYQCDVCGKQFRERGSLTEHNRIHTGVMPYSCEYCGKHFRFKGILTVHLRQHTGERPYNCKECRRDFTNWANYNKHMKRRHKGKEPAETEDLSNSNPPEEGPVRVDTEPLLDISPPPSFVEPISDQTTAAPPPSYKLPEEDLFGRINASSLPSPPLQLYLNPFHMIQRGD